MSIWRDGQNIRRSDYHDDGLVVEEPALTPAEVTDNLRRAYDQWTARENLQRVEPLMIPLGPIAEIVATDMFRGALVFTVLHEFGHAACGHDVPGNPITQEPEADRWAARALFSTAVAALQQPDYLLGAAFLSIRALASRERVQKSDLHGYPPSEQRFTALIEIARQLFPNELVFYMKTTSAFTADMRLQTAEHDLGAGVSPAPSQSEQIVSLIVSRLQSVVKQKAELGRAIEEIVTALKRVPAPVVQGTAEICQRVLGPQLQPEGPHQEEQVQNFCDYSTILFLICLRLYEKGEYPWPPRPIWTTSLFSN